MARKWTVNASELGKVPFVDATNIGGRVVTTLTFYEEGKWHMWVATPEQLIPIKGQPIEADYFGRMPEKNTDIYMDFLNFMTQRACWADVMGIVDGLRNDVHNLGASLAKLDLFHRTSEGKRIDVTRFVATEIEYIFFVCRSMFDLLQEVIARLWDRIELLDKGLKKRNLPQASFGKMVLDGERLRGAGEIEEKWKIPSQLASFYCRQGPFFEVLRRYRDDLVHRGRDFKFIFVTQKGFAVSASQEPFASFGVWNEEHMEPNRLASLRPVIAHVISETVRACEDFTNTIQRIIKFPPEIAPGFRLFIRGHHNQQLLDMQRILDKCLWWEETGDCAEG